MIFVRNVSNLVYLCILKYVSSPCGLKGYSSEGREVVSHHRVLYRNVRIKCFVLSDFGV